MTKQLISWLRENWLDQGPSVCVLEGESGIGKTTLLGQLLDTSSLPSVRVNASAGQLGLDDTLLELALALENIGICDMADQADGNLCEGMSDALNREVLIAIDDFDELIDPTTAMPPKALLDMVREVSRKNCSGRLILVSSRTLAEGSWQEGVAVRTVPPPREHEAVEFLTRKLQERDRESEVPGELRKEVVHWLGSNPRTLEALVACLQFYSLDELIELEQDAWGVRDQVVSPALIGQLEERFTERTLCKLAPEALLLLQYLAVYRKPFIRDVLDRLPPKLRQWEFELQSRFLLTRRTRWFKLSRYAREIARSQIEDQSAEKQYTDAHSVASDHFARHFKNPTTEDVLRHSGEFVEARFHLARCGRGDEFYAVAHAVRSNLLIGATGVLRRLPEDSSDREQLIMCLGAGLSIDNTPQPSARTLLARLLLARNGRDDKIRALLQLELATRGRANQTAWMLRIQLSGEVGSIASFRASAQQALVMAPAASKYQFYYQIAKIHILAGRVAEGAAIINEGIKKIENPTGLADLHQIRAALMCRQNHYDEAIAELRNFVQSDIFKLVPTKFKQRTYERVILIAQAARASSELENVLERLADEPTLRPQKILCKLAILQVKDRFADVDLIDRPEVLYPAEVAQRAFSLLCVGQQRAALDLLADGYEMKGPQAWLWALAAHSSGLKELAVTAVKELTEGEVAPDSVTPELLVNLWQNIGEGLDRNIAFWHPRLPRGLTGLRQDLIRLQIPHARLSRTLMRQVVFHVNPIVDAEVMTVPKMATLDPLVNDRPLHREVVTPQTLIAPVIAIHIQGETVSEGSKYSFSGPVAAAGDNATAHDFVQSYQQTGDAALRDELLRVISEMRTRAVTAEQNSSASEVKLAEAALSTGDTAAAKSHLARAGEWALTTATAIGAAVAAAAIKAAIGF